MTKLLAEEKDLAEEAKSHVKPEKPDDVVDLDVYRTRLANLERDYETATKTLELFEQKGVTECPTCGTEVKELKGHLEECKKTVKHCAEKRSKLCKQISCITTYQDEARRYDKWQEIHEQKVKATQDARIAMAFHGPGSDKRSREDLESVISTFTTTKESMEKMDRLYQSAVKEALKSEELQKHLNARLTELKQKMDDNKICIEYVAKAKERLEEHEEVRELVANTQGKLEAMNTQITSVEEQLDKLKTKLKRSKKVRRMVKVMSIVRDGMHKNSLPQRVAQSNLQLMEGDINKGLGWFADPFWVEADDNLGFKVHKPGEPPQRAERLSMGQRILLAIAFWRAVGSLFKSDIGMMVLDEPTANLDEVNRKYLAEAMTQLTKRVRGKSQLFLITHAEECRSSFDQVIDL